MPFLHKPQSHSSNSFWPTWQENKPFTLLLAIFLVYATVYVGTLIQNNFRQFLHIGQSPAQARTVSVSGEGKAIGTPTVASVNIGLLTEKNDVLSAQQENSEKMNALIKAIKELDIAPADIQTTQYQIYPRYDYPNGKSMLAGYTVSQSAEVKIRDFKKISSVLERAGATGANQVSGISFTIDDPRALQTAARDKAIGDAREKAGKLAAALGVRLGKVISWSEYGGQPGPAPVFMKEGLGGGARVAPEIESGSLEVISNVTITYEIE